MFFAIAAIVAPVIGVVSLVPKGYSSVPLLVVSPATPSKTSSVIWGENYSTMFPDSFRFPTTASFAFSVSCLLNHRMINLFSPHSQRTSDISADGVCHHETANKRLCDITSNDFSRYSLKLTTTVS